MRKVRFAFAVAGATSVAWGALFLLGACTANGTSASDEPLPTGDSGHTTLGTDAGSSDDSGDPGTDDGGGDCGKPASLHVPKPDGGMYCPFSAADGGKTVYCPITDQCCETPSGTSPSTCETKGSTCPVSNSTVWECQSPADCTGGQKCCAHSGTAAAVTVGSDTCGPYLSKFSGTHCAASCASGELVVCEQPSDCSSGTCTAVKPKGNDVGVCN